MANESLRSESVREDVLSASSSSVRKDDLEHWLNESITGKCNWVPASQSCKTVVLDIRHQPQCQDKGLRVVERIISGSIIGIMKGDTRSFDHGS